MLIRIPVPGTEYALEFDSGKIVTVEAPREVAQDLDTGHRKLAGPNALILRFATLDDAPIWAAQPEVPAADMQAPDTAVLLAALEAMAMLIREEYGGGQHSTTPIAPFVAAFTDAPPAQVEAVEQVERYWGAVRAADHPVTARGEMERSP